ncbi:MAG: 1-acyl-sn-glycerol-3-phosphate acyltransferase [Bdellovibrionales bacterium]|nr:1-acyl-sn-glycerol-3-phosphate acyltransferase [Bdellovibrionales bacterium]
MEKWDYENEQWLKLPNHLKHLPLFTRSFDLVSIFFKYLWALILKIIFTFYIRIKIFGPSWKKIFKQHPKLLIMSNHSSHLDAVAIAATIPVGYWSHLYLTAAKDYWFSNPIFTFFSKHCLGAIPIDRKENPKEAISLCTTLLNNLTPIWMLLFPEGSRSSDGTLQKLKAGISIFSQKTNTPILFLYLEGANKLLAKSKAFPKAGVLKLHIGKVIQPTSIEEVQEQYTRWVAEINSQDK